MQSLLDSNATDLATFTNDDLLQASGTGGVGTAAFIAAAQQRAVLQFTGVYVCIAAVRRVIHQ